MIRSLPELVQEQEVSYRVDNVIRKQHLALPGSGQGQQAVRQRSVSVAPSVPNGALVWKNSDWRDAMPFGVQCREVDHDVTSHVLCCVC